MVHSIALLPWSGIPDYVCSLKLPGHRALQGRRPDDAIEIEHPQRGELRPASLEQFCGARRIERVKEVPIEIRQIVQMKNLPSPMRRSPRR
jgi:hypothetical protein